MPAARPTGKRKRRAGKRRRKAPRSSCRSTRESSSPRSGSSPPPSSRRRRNRESQSFSILRTERSWHDHERRAWLVRVGNRAVADAYEPGSTFKIVTGSLALENSLVTLDELIDTGNGTIRVGNTTISEHDRKQYGSLTLAGIFEHSSNVGIIRVGLRLGPARLWQGATSLGVGRASGVDLPGENAGIFRRPERWSGLSNAMISMGQEVSVTPLQLARVAAAIANGGRLVQPRLVRRIVHPDGRVEVIVPSPPQRVLSEATARTVRNLLVGVVERGTGKKAAIPGFVVAGKTGTEIGRASCRE